MKSLGNCQKCGKANDNTEHWNCSSCREKRRTGKPRISSTWAKKFVVDGVENKQCKKCGDPFPLTSEFWVMMRGQFVSPCKKCKRDKKRNQYSSDPLFRRKQIMARTEDHKKSRLRCLTEYSGGSLRCACCGEDHYEFLTIDHIHGDGASHRREISGNRIGSIYRWLEVNKFPSGFRVLCYNCNCVRSTCGYCPHDREREVLRNEQRFGSELRLHGAPIQ